MLNFKRSATLLVSSLLTLGAMADELPDDYNPNPKKIFNTRLSDDTVYMIIIGIVCFLFICVLIRSIYKYMQKRQKDKRRAIRRRHYHEARDRYYRHHPEELKEKDKSIF